MVYTDAAVSRNRLLHEWQQEWILCKLNIRLTKTLRIVVLKVRTTIRLSQVSLRKERETANSITHHMMV